MSVKHTCFTTFHAVAADQHNHDKIDAIAVRAFRRWPADAARGVNAKLVSFDEPLIDRLDLPKQSSNCAQKVDPQRIACNRWLNWFEPAFKAAMQCVVIKRLPVCTMRYRQQGVVVKILDETGMPTFAVMATIAQMHIGRQTVPRVCDRRPMLFPVT